MNEQGNGKEKKTAKNKIETAWYKRLPDTLCVIGAIVLVVIIAYLFTRDYLSVQNTILLTFIAIIVTAVISVYVGKYYSRVEAFKSIEGEATKALRRIVRIKDSTGRILENCQRIMKDISTDYEDDDEQKILLEYFNGLCNQLSDLLGNINSSIDDWGDMVPDKVQNIREYESEQANAYGIMLEKMEQLFEEYRTRLGEANEEQKETIKNEMREGIKNIRNEWGLKQSQIKFDALQRNIPVSSLSSSAVTTVTSGSTFTPTWTTTSTTYPWATGFDNDIIGEGASFHSTTKKKPKS